jgi:hypothetical protein
MTPSNRPELPLRLLGLLHDDLGLLVLLGIVEVAR